MFSKLFGATGRQAAPMLETPNQSRTLAQLMGGPGEGANAKAQTSLSVGQGAAQSEKDLLRQKLMEIQAEHNPEPEIDPVADQEDIALVRYVFESKPHIMKHVLKSIIEDSLFNSPADQGQSSNGAL